MAQLTNEELIAFTHDGVLGPFDLPTDVFRKYLDVLPATLERISKISNVLERRNQHTQSEALVDLVTCAPVMERVNAMLGRDVLLWTAHVIPRAPGSGGQAWHVDVINQLTRGLHLSVALTDMNRRNGCMRVVRGSHRYHPSLSRAQERLQSDEDVERFADEAAPWNAPHLVSYIEARAGQCFLTWGGLWHGVGTNQTSEDRIACVARYARTDVTCRLFGLVDHDITCGPKIPCVLVSGEDKHGLNDVVPRPRGE